MVCFNKENCQGATAFERHDTINMMQLTFNCINGVIKQYIIAFIETDCRYYMSSLHDLIECINKSSGAV